MKLHFYSAQCLVSTHKNMKPFPRCCIQNIDAVIASPLFYAPKYVDALGIWVISGTVTSGTLWYGILCWEIHREPKVIICELEDIQ